MNIFYPLFFYGNNKVYRIKAIYQLVRLLSLPPIMRFSSITGHKDLKMIKRHTHVKAEDLALKLG